MCVCLKEDVFRCYIVVFSFFYHRIFALVVYETPWFVFTCAFSPFGLSVVCTLYQSVYVLVHCVLFSCFWLFFWLFAFVLHTIGDVLHKNIKFFCSTPYILFYNLQCMNMLGFFLYFFFQREIRK